MRGPPTRVEHEFDDSVLPGDITANRVIDRAVVLLEAVDRYRRLLHDPRAVDPSRNVDFF